MNIGNGKTEEELPPSDTSWTVRQVARFLQLSDDTVRKMAQNGQLNGKKVGKEWRFDPVSVRAIIKP